jgi:hypothetical protein
MPDELAVRVEHIEKQLQLAETYSITAFWLALDRA